MKFLSTKCTIEILPFSNYDAFLESVMVLGNKIKCRYQYVLSIIVIKLKHLSIVL